jgi:hypothetical protein
MWMGGNVPLGYDASERTLVINPAEAETVRRVFALYRELGCVRRVKEAADRLGLRTKCRTTANGTERGGKPFSRGHLYTLLSNPIYTGQIAHKGELHPGQQTALIDDESWSTVRDQPIPVTDTLAAVCGWWGDLSSATRGIRSSNPSSSSSQSVSAVPHRARRGCRWCGPSHVRSVHGEVETPGYVLLNTGGHADASGLGQSFETGSYIYPIAEDVAVLGNNIPDINAHTKFDAFVVGDPGITLGHAGLDLGRTSQGTNHTGKFDQQAITSSNILAPWLSATSRHIPRARRWGQSTHGRFSIDTGRLAICGRADDTLR